MKIITLVIFAHEQHIHVRECEVCEYVIQKIRKRISLMHREFAQTAAITGANPPLKFRCPEHIYPLRPARLNRKPINLYEVFPSNGGLFACYFPPHTVSYRQIQN